MGSTSSRPKMYPFPMPGTDSSKSTKWSFSTKKKGKKSSNHEKLDDFIVSKYPSPTAPYGFPYYPQMQSAFPAYYAPVQMALVQPVLAMPQAYLPMAYQTTAAPIQPAAAPVPALPAPPAMQMPVPAPAPASMLVPAPAPPPIAPTQMPQPQPPRSTGPTFPPSPIPAHPVIPPPPIVNSEPRAPDSGRIRFTDFYRPTNPSSPHRRPSVDEPVRPPTAGPAGRTPFPGAMPMPEPSSSPAPMPMPMPGPGPGSAPTTIPRSNNPLPPPPADVWGTSPYRQVLANLPAELPDILDFPHRPDVLVGDPEPVSRPSSRLGGMLGSKDKGKKPLRGLFRSRSTSVQPDAGAGSSHHGHGHGHTRSHTMATIVIPPSATGSTSTPGLRTMDMPAPSVGPPVRFDHTGELGGFVNHSSHRVMYKNKMYPTALHLLEAMKFAHQPALQERIRTCKDVHDMYPLSASLQEHVRPDWGQVFLKTMEDVLYLKFKQHPVLRALLLRTGLADIIYSDENSYWGNGSLGQGANELGKALVRLRERLRQEGEN